MKNAFLIWLMLVLPLQALAAVEKNFVHLVGKSGISQGYLIKHIGEHANHVLHHHDQHEDDDDEGGALHVDSSDKSAQHVADSDQAGNMNLLFHFFALPDAALAMIDAPIGWDDGFRTRSTLPLLRPPRLPA